MSLISLTEFNIQRPQKVLWRLPEITDSTIDPLTFVRSKSLKKFLKQSDEVLKQAGIDWKFLLPSTQEFQDWLRYYQKKMLEKNYRIIASMEWYQQKIAAGNQVEALFFYQNDNLAGSCIFLTKDTTANLSFRASEPLNFKEKNASIGSVIYYFYVREMLRRGCTTILSGRSRNAFGVYNSIGYLEHKTRFGFSAQSDLQLPFEETVPVDDQGCVLFYGEKEGVISLFGLKPKNSPIMFEAQQFATGKIAFQVLEY